MKEKFKPIIQSPQVYSKIFVAVTAKDLRKRRIQNFIKKGFILFVILALPLGLSFFFNSSVRATANIFEFDPVVTFDTTASSTAEKEPNYADFNGDNKIDLLTENYSDNTISVFIGNGDGTFDPAVVYPVGDGAIDSEVKDLDGDGDIDIIISNIDSGEFSVLINDGLGVFAPAVNTFVDANMSDMAAADLNNDNYADVVVTSSVPDQTSVFLNNGDGTFAAAVDYANSDYAGDVKVADLNNDNFLDIVSMYCGTNTISVLLNNGDGTFAVEETYTTGSCPVALVTDKDLNGDDIPDIVTVNDVAPSSDNFSVLLNNGDGTFAAPVDYSTSDFIYIPNLDDIDHDNDNDLVINSTAGDIFVFLNDGSGLFGPELKYLGSGGNFSSFRLVDLNNDSDLDILQGRTSIGVEIRAGNGDGTFGDTQSFSVPSLISTGATVDLNNDSFLDIVGMDSFGSLNVDVLLNILATQQSGPSRSSGSAARPRNTTTVISPSNVSCIDSHSCVTENNIDPKDLNPITVKPTLVFLRNLSLGSIGADVKALQVYLNSNGFVLASNGAGSRDEETSYFGNRTRIAVIKFQEAFKDQILTPLGLTKGTGYFGDRTREFVNNKK